MRQWPRLSGRVPWRGLAVALLTLPGATLIIALLENNVGLPNASAAYLVAVVAVALVSGPIGAAVAAVLAALLYDFLFTEPYFTLTISDPDDWLNVILLLFVGVVVGQLAARQRLRAEQAIVREREARALFQISRSLATRSSTAPVLADIAQVLAANTHLDRVWLTLTADGRDRSVADTGSGLPPDARFHSVLRRTPGDAPAEWLRVHDTTRAQTGSGSPPREARGAMYKVRIEVGDRSLGSIWGWRERRDDDPDRTERRLLAAAADQIGQALTQDALATQAQAAEVARQSDALKSSLLQAVSHDLRTPLATIRTAAGTLRPESGLASEERKESAEAIEREVEYLDRLVTNLLDLGRIEAGALRPELDAFDLEDLVDRSVARLRSRLEGRLLALDLEGSPVLVDPVFVDEAIGNLLDNSIRYAPPAATIRLTSQDLPEDGYVRLTIEDSGPGVAEADLDRIFEKFYRGAAGGSTRVGTGVGLAVVRGLVEATGGRVTGRRSDLGGLAVDLDLPRARLPTELADPT